MIDDDALVYFHNGRTALMLEARVVSSQGSGLARMHKWGFWDDPDWGTQAKGIYAR